ncbi:MAG: hypothetical protein V1843_02765 [bacterium]
MIFKKPKLENYDVKKIYLYLVCLFTLFILLWGVIDFLSGSIHLVSIIPNLPAMANTSSDMASNEFFQKQMIYDRIGDGFARLLVAGIIFGYFSIKLKNYEGVK